MRSLHTSKQLLKRTLSSAARYYNQKQRPLAPELWGLDISAAGRLELEGLDLAELTGRWGSPLHVVHAAALRRNIAAFTAAEAGHTPCEVYYSYKTNPIPAVLRLMHSLGVGAEVISEYELWLALRLGVEPSQIVYNGPVKSDASLREAISREIGLINANHREEIARIARIASELGKRPRVGVRVCTSHSWSGQFGAAIASGEALEAVGEAAREPALQVVALHAHLGAPLRSEGQLMQLIDETLDFAEHAERTHGVQFEIIDLGGSLAVPTVQFLSGRDKRLNMTFLADLPVPELEATLSIRDYVGIIQRRVQARFARLGRKPPRIFLEPGRAMTSSTQLLVASVHSIKAARGAAPYAILDAGINLAQSMQSEYHRVFAATKMRERATVSYRLAGPICSPGDVLSWACSLPELAPGDTLVIADAGAYFVPFATSFSYPQPAIVLVDGGEVSLIRRAERFEDLVALDQF